MNNTTNIVPANNEFTDITNESGTALTVRDFAQPSGNDLYASFNPVGFDGKMNLFNAINNPDADVLKMVGQVIALKEIVVHPVTLEDEQTGEVVHALRTIIIDDEGKTYKAVSLGFSSALQRLIEQFGQPAEWEAPILIKIQQEETRKGNNRVTTFSVVGQKKK